MDQGAKILEVFEILLKDSEMPILYNNSKIKDV